MPYLLVIVFVVFEQLLFKGLSFGFAFDVSIIFHLLFSVLPATLIFVICNLFKEKINKILLYILISTMSVLTAAQYVYYCIYSSPFSIYSLTQGGMGQAFSFVPQILKTMWHNMDFLFFFLPILVLAILFRMKKIHLAAGKKDIIIYLLVGAFVFCGTLICVNLDNKSIASSSEIYYSSDNILLRSNKFGIYTGLMLDVNDVILGDSVGTLGLFKDGKKTDKKDNVSLTDEIKEYILSAKLAEKNEYTGLFKDKNLILIMGESLSPYAINKDITPTLYKLSQEGFNFNNYYSPLYPVSTADGEYMALTGLVPASNIWSLTSLKDKNNTNNLAALLKKNGYSTMAYHNHTKEFYTRYKALPKMGFETFKSCPDLGINCNLWPESDLEMMEKTVSTYINKSSFFAYYETASGHLQYSKANQMAAKNWKYVEKLKYMDTVKYYLAAQIELDKALENLIGTLEKENKLDNTVIAIYSDHYPYGLTLEELSNLAGKSIDEKFDRDKGTFIIWNSKTKGKQVSTLSSGIDIFPTLANMFDLDLDSRNIIGRDIFSNTDKIVMFSDQSFITDKVKFNNITNTYVPLNNSNVSSDEIEELRIDVSNKFKVSAAMLEADYFSINTK